MPVIFEEPSGFVKLCDMPVKAVERGGQNS